MHIAMAELTAQQVQESVHRITGLEQPTVANAANHSNEHCCAFVSAVESHTTGSLTGCCEATRGNH